MGSKESGFVSLLTVVIGQLVQAQTTKFQVKFLQEIQNISKELNDYIHAHVLIHPNIIKGGTGL